MRDRTKLTNIARIVLKVNAILYKQPRRLLISIGFALVFVIGALDYITGTEFSFALFYLLPISLLTWFVGSRVGIVVAILSAAGWSLAEWLSGHVYSHPWARIWNDLTELAIFLVVTFILSALKYESDHHQTLALTDPLTGVANKRAFRERINDELMRANRYRHPFTLAYMDLDNFKLVNDRLGHQTGDELLQAAAKTIKQSIRAIDFVARIGGDEFALLLPESNMTSARQVLNKLQRDLINLMRQHDWPVTFSIGAVTVNDGSVTTDEIIEQADKLLYEVKKGGKNMIKLAALGANGLAA